jgi:hypothetical protein
LFGKGRRWDDAGVQPDNAPIQRGFLVAAAAIAVITLSPPRAEAAVVANVVANSLTVTGDALDNTITLRVAAGDATRIRVLDGNTVLGSFLRATFSAIAVDGAAGNDTITLTDINGIFTEPAGLFGGPHHRRRLARHAERRRRRRSPDRR